MWRYYFDPSSLYGSPDITYFCTHSGNFSSKSYLNKNKFTKRGIPKESTKLGRYQKRHSRRTK